MEMNETFKSENKERRRNYNVSSFMDFIKEKDKRWKTKRALYNLLIYFFEQVWKYGLSLLNTDYYSQLQSHNIRDNNLIRKDEKNEKIKELVKKMSMFSEKLTEQLKTSYPNFLLFNDQECNIFLSAISDDKTIENALWSFINQNRTDSDRKVQNLILSEIVKVYVKNNIENLNTKLKNTNENLIFSYSIDNRDIFGNNINWFREKLKYRDFDEQTQIDADFLLSMLKYLKKLQRKILEEKYLSDSENLRILEIKERLINQESNDFSIKFLIDNFSSKDFTVSEESFQLVNLYIEDNQFSLINILKKSFCSSNADNNTAECHEIIFEELFLHFKDLKEIIKNKIIMDFLYENSINKEQSDSFSYKIFIRILEICEIIDLSKKKLEMKDTEDIILKLQKYKSDYQQTQGEIILSNYDSKFNLGQSSNSNLNFLEDIVINKLEGELREITIKVRNSFETKHENRNDIFNTFNRELLAPNSEGILDNSKIEKANLSIVLTEFSKVIYPSLEVTPDIAEKIFKKIKDFYKNRQYNLMFVNILYFYLTWNRLERGNLFDSISPLHDELRDFLKIVFKQNKIYFQNFLSFDNNRPFMNKKQDLSPIQNSEYSEKSLEDTTKERDLFETNVVLLTKTMILRQEYKELLNTSIPDYEKEIFEIFEIVNKFSSISVRIEESNDPNSGQRDFIDLVNLYVNLFKMNLALTAMRKRFFRETYLTGCSVYPVDKPLNIFNEKVFSEEDLRSYRIKKFIDTLISFSPEIFKKKLLSLKKEITRNVVKMENDKEGAEQCVSKLRILEELIDEKFLDVDNLKLILQDLKNKIDNQLRQISQFSKNFHPKNVEKDNQEKEIHKINEMYKRLENYEASLGDYFKKYKIIPNINGTLKDVQKMMEQTFNNYIDKKPKLQGERRNTDLEIIVKKLIIIYKNSINFKFLGNMINSKINSYLINIKNTNSNFKQIFNDLLQKPVLQASGVAEVVKDFINRNYGKIKSSK